MLIGILACIVAIGPARAEGCTKSRDYILDSADLPQKPERYRELFRMCLETLELSNVQDAFILKAGAVAIVPRNDSVPATASTLAQFCTRFPGGHAHFVGRKERRHVANIARAIEFGSARSTPCLKIGGGG
jgi:hypothetical protein